MVGCRQETSKIVQLLILVTSSYIVLLREILSSICIEFIYYKFDLSALVAVERNWKCLWFNRIWYESSWFLIYLFHNWIDSKSILIALFRDVINFTAKFSCVNFSYQEFVCIQSRSTKLSLAQLWFITRNILDWFVIINKICSSIFPSLSAYDATATVTFIHPNYV